MESVWNGGGLRGMDQINPGMKLIRGMDRVTPESKETLPRQA